MTERKKEEQGLPTPGHVNPVVPRQHPFPESAPKPLQDDPSAAERVSALLASPAYRRPNRDLELLAREELRTVRLQLEYTKAELLLREAGVTSTIVVFGGSRMVEPAAAVRELEAARAALAERPRDPERVRLAAVAERKVANSRYYDVARDFGGLIAAQGDGLVIATGGGPGIMEAANRGAFDAGAKTIGLNVTLPHEQFPNPYITPGLCFQFRYFALRKLHFLKRAKALVAFPGGYGTLDEVFEALCLVQTETINPMPIVLVGAAFWNATFDPRFLAAEGMIDPEDLALFQIAETAEEIWGAITAWYQSAGAQLTGK